MPAPFPGFYGLERLHPFDSKKFQRVLALLEEAGVLDRGRLVTAAEAGHDILREVHTEQYLRQLDSSPLKVAQVRGRGWLTGAQERVAMLRPSVVCPLQPAAQLLSVQCRGPGAWAACNTAAGLAAPQPPPPPSHPTPTPPCPGHRAGPAAPAAALPAAEKGAAAHGDNGRWQHAWRCPGHGAGLGHQPGRGHAPRLPQRRERQQDAAWPAWRLLVGRLCRCCRGAALQRSWRAGAPGTCPSLPGLQGGGWCPYSDITLALRRLRAASGGAARRVLAVDLDVHQAGAAGLAGQTGGGARGCVPCQQRAHVAAGGSSEECLAAARRHCWRRQPANAQPAGFLQPSLGLTPPLALPPPWSPPPGSPPCCHVCAGQRHGAGQAGRGGR